jgi:hypothetical protein
MDMEAEMWKKMLNACLFEELSKTGRQRNHDPFDHFSHQLGGVTHQLRLDKPLFSVTKEELLLFDGQAPTCHDPHVVNSTSPTRNKAQRLMPSPQTSVILSSHEANRMLGLQHEDSK